MRAPFVASNDGTSGVQAEAVQAVVGCLAEEQQRVARGGFHGDTLLAARRIRWAAHVLHSQGLRVNFR